MADVETAYLLQASKKSSHQTLLKQSDIWLEPRSCSWVLRQLVDYSHAPRVLFFFFFLLPDKKSYAEGQTTYYGPMKAVANQRSYALHGVVNLE